MKSKGVKIVIGAIVGAAIGFAVGYFGKCASGTCPLTSNPFISTVVGGLLGALTAGSTFLTGSNQDHHS
jgi:hypothetical protein